MSIDGRFSPCGNGSMVRLALAPTPHSVAVARHAVARWARQAGADASVEIATLLTSEVATNVVKHAGTAYTVTARWLPPILRVEVTDATPPPKRVARRAGQVGGWGFELLDQLSRSWGIDRRSGDTKAVWFEVQEPA
jgi:anti-sigma regulatory factor (Ser/Thr protein kinase)